jgi:hypothetical protein
MIERSGTAIIDGRPTEFQAYGKVWKYEYTEQDPEYKQPRRPIEGTGKHVGYRFRIKGQEQEFPLDRVGDMVVNGPIPTL